MTAVAVFHKNPVSARLRLLRFAGGGLLGPDDPPRGSEAGAVGEIAAPHPGALAAALSAAFGVPGAAFRPLAPELLRIGGVPVFAVECTAFDPPPEVAAAAGGAWIDFTAVRGLAPSDREVARALYARVVG